MASEAIVQALASRLFASDHANVFAILDGASVPKLIERIVRDNPDYVCLYRGDLEPDLAEAAPYLVQLEAGSDFARWVIEQGWGEHWGVFAVSEAGLRTMRQHFRRFLMVHDESGKPLYFRYYDPRVLRAYLPTCSIKELNIVFGPIQYYYVEGEDPTVLLRFGYKDGDLAERKVELVRAARDASRLASSPSGREGLR